MGAVKQHILRSKLRLRPGDVVRKLRESLNGRVRRRVHSNKGKRLNEDIDSAEEAWGKRQKKKQKKAKFVKPRTKNATAEVTTDDGTGTLKFALRWGGNHGQIRFTNTCTIDVGLTLMSMLSHQYPQVLENAAHSPYIQKLIECIDLIKDGKPNEARYQWCTFCKVLNTEEMSRNIWDMYKSEFESFVKFVNAGQTFQTEERCNKDDCGTPIKIYSSSIIYLE